MTIAKYIKEIEQSVSEFSNKETRTDFSELLVDGKRRELYQRCKVNPSKFIPTVKIGRNQIVFISRNENVSPEYYVRKSKYPLRYEVMEESSKLEDLVKQCKEVNGW